VLKLSRCGSQDNQVNKNSMLKSVFLLNSKKKVLSHRINSVVSSINEVSLYVSVDDLTKVLLFFKNDENCLYKVLVDIFVVDFFESQKRFEIIYCLLSVKYNTRIKIKCRLDEFTPLVSVVSLFSNANWLEREIWDMYGIFIQEHPDLRRLLTDYGFEGYPLRKDFPLSGYIECRYDESQKRVVSESLELAQDFRVFNFESPWKKKNK